MALTSESQSKKRKRFFEFLQGAAAHSLRSHVCTLRSVFCYVHAAAKNGLNFYFTAKR
jgi:hypothetical protein